MIPKNDILEALKNIIDPDLHQDIVSLGFIKNLSIHDTHVQLDIELTTPACPVKSEFQQKAEDLIKNIPGVKSVTVQMTSQPVKRSVAAQNLSSGLNDVKSIIAVSSCKGGVGKSTMAAALAKELSQRGFKVGLLDADIYGPSMPSLFNAYQISIHTNEKQQIIPSEIGKLKVMSFGFLLGDSPAVMRGPIVSRYIQQLLHQTDWGKLDYLFIDMPPGTGDVQLTITQNVNLSGAIIVTTRQTLSLVDVARGILMFETVKVPMLGIIENMSHFICDGCGKKHFIFGAHGEDLLKDRFGLETLAQIPILPALSSKFDQEIHILEIQNAVDQVVRAIGKMSRTQNLVPKYMFDAQNLTLEWPDGKIFVVSNRALRLSCRCALCVNELTGEKILREDRIQNDIMPKEIMTLGNYALGIKWNDGHSSGIYPYASIEKLAGKSVNS